MPLLGNTTLSDLERRTHSNNLRTDEQGNTSTLHTITFRVDNTFPTILIMAPIIAAAVVSVYLYFYFKKRKH